MDAPTAQRSWAAFGLGRGLLRALRWAGLMVLGFLAALGAVTASWLSLILAAALAGLGWGFMRALHSCSGPDGPRVPHPAVAATWMAVLPAAVGGTALLGLGPMGVAGAAVGVALAVGWWGASCAAPRPHQPGRDRVPDRDDGSLHDLLRAVSVDVLCDEWRATAGPVLPGERDARARTRMRCLLIAELSRRDPVGTARWLNEAPDVPPDGYVRDSGDRAC